MLALKVHCLCLKPVRWINYEKKIEAFVQSLVTGVLTHTLKLTEAVYTDSIFGLDFLGMKL
jgi:hypothetical protein